VSGLTTLGNTSNTGNLGVAGTTTLSTVSATNINFTGGLYSNGVIFSGGSGSPSFSTISTIGQAAFYSSVQIQGGLSVFSSLTARNINFTGLLTSNGTTFSGAPAGINSAGSIGIGAAAGGTTLLVTGTQSNTQTLGVAGNTTLSGTLGVAGAATFNTLTCTSPFNVYIGNCNVLTTENPSWGNCTLYLRSMSNTGQLGITSALGTAGNGAASGQINDSVIRNYNGGLCLASQYGYGMRINPNGCVTVDNWDDGSSTSGAVYIYAGGGASGTTTSAYGSLSLITTKNVWVKGGYLLVSSDERIKKNIQTVTDSLDIINKLNIVSFDRIEIDKPSVKHGVIAQEVQKVYPEAVGTNTDFVPSVYSLATYELSGNVIITSEVITGFSVNDKVRLFINTDSNIDTADYIYDTNVLEIISDTQFTVAAWDKFELGKDLLIYGKEVDDFLTVDKQQIGILAAGACKVLSGQVSTLQQENVELRSTIAAILDKYPL